MSRGPVVLVDGNRDVHGGVERLNTAAIAVLQERALISRTSLITAFWRIVWGRKPHMVIIDLPLTWKRVLPVFLLRLICSFNWGGKILLLLREHNYSPSFEMESVPNTIRFHILLRIGYGLVDRVVCVCHAQKRWMNERRLCDPAKSQTLIHAVDIEELLTLPLPTDSQPVFGVMGRMTRQKGFDILIDAWRKAKCAGNSKLLIGGTGPEKANLIEQAKGIKTIEFVGAVENRRAFYERCSCIAIPSRWEPYGQVCLEARAAGRAVIVSDADGLPEQLEASMCGLIFRRGDSEDLAEKIGQMYDLLLVPGQRQRMGREGRKVAAETRGQFLKEFSNLLESTIPESSGPESKAVGSSPRCSAPLPSNHGLGISQRGRR